MDKLACVSFIPLMPPKLPKTRPHQTLLLAGQTAAASDAVAALRPGPDKAYLTSEAAWRAGDVHRAAATLFAHAARCGGVALPPKLAAAASFVD